MGFELYQNPYHINVMRSQLTRNIGVLYPELRDEIITAFDEILDLKDNGNVFPVIKNKDLLILDDIEWKSVPALTTIQQIVCRASNRSFVGLPVCMYSLSLPARVSEHLLQVVTRISWLSTSNTPLMPSQAALSSDFSRNF